MNFFFWWFFRPNLPNFGAWQIAAFWPFLNQHVTHSLNKPPKDPKVRRLVLPLKDKLFLYQRCWDSWSYPPAIPKNSELQGWWVWKNNPYKQPSGCLTSMFFSENLDIISSCFRCHAASWKQCKVVYVHVYASCGIIWNIYHVAFFKT